MLCLCCAVPVLNLDAEGKQREKAERLRFGRFFYRLVGGYVCGLLVGCVGLCGGKSGAYAYAYTRYCSGCSVSAGCASSQQVAAVCVVCCRWLLLNTRVFMKLLVGGWVTPSLPWLLYWQQATMTKLLLCALSSHDGTAQSQPVPSALHSLTRPSTTATTMAALHCAPPRFPNGESGADVYDRITVFIDHLIRDINAGRFPPGTSLVLVTHGLALRCDMVTCDDVRGVMGEGRACGSHGGAAPAGWTRHMQVLCTVGMHVLQHDTRVCSAVVAETYLPADMLWVTAGSARVPDAGIAPAHRKDVRSTPSC